MPRLQQLVELQGQQAETKKLEKKSSPFDNFANTALTSPCLSFFQLGHEDRVWCATWHPTKPILATCSGDKTVRIWQSTNAQDPTVWQCTNVLEGGHKRTIRSVAWSPDGRQLATGSFDATTGVWERDEDENGGKGLGVGVLVVKSGEL